MKRPPNKRRLKKNRHYTYESAAAQLGKTPQTIRSWRKRGLQVMSETRPHLILGESLIGFLERTRQDRATQLGADQFMCLSCRKPIRPLGMMADYQLTNAGHGQLIALCETCETCCYKFATATQLNDLSQILDIAAKGTSEA